MTEPYFPKVFGSHRPSIAAWGTAGSDLGGCCDGFKAFGQPFRMYYTGQRSIIANPVEFEKLLEPNAVM